MKTILVPTDFSEKAQYSLDLAHEIASKASARVRLINVIEPPGESSFNTMGEVTAPNAMDNVFVVQLLEKTREKIKKIVEDKKYKDIELTGHVHVGNPYHSIAKDISNENVDLVIMGTHGATGLEEAFVGSNTEKVVRRAKCPVISVKQETHVKDIKSIAYATDLGEYQDKVIPGLKKLQELLGAKLHIFKVNTPNNFTTDRHDRTLINEFIKKHKISNYTVSIYNDFNEEDGIIYFAEDMKADMIAMATHGRTGLLHILSGSIAEDVVNHAKRPVWTLSVKALE